MFAPVKLLPVFRSLFLMTLLFSLSGCFLFQPYEDLPTVSDGDMQNVIYGFVQSREKVWILGDETETLEGRKSTTSGKNKGGGFTFGSGGIGFSFSSDPDAENTDSHGRTTRTKSRDKTKGYMYRVVTDAGKHLSVSQSLKPEIQIGQRVMILEAVKDKKGRVKSPARIFPYVPTQGDDGQPEKATQGNVKKNTHLHGKNQPGKITKPTVKRKNTSSQKKHS